MNAYTIERVFYLENNSKYHMLHMFKIKKTTDPLERRKQEFEFINKHRKHLNDADHQKKVDEFDKENAGELELHLRAEREILQRMGMKPEAIEAELKRTAKMFRHRKKYVVKKMHEDRIKEKLFDKYDKDELFS